MTTLADALAKATANGWSDDSRWTPSTVAHQVSTERNGFLAAVKVLTGGEIRWAVHTLTDKARGQAGTAPTVDAALAACDNSISAATGTLF